MAWVLFLLLVFSNGHILASYLSLKIPRVIRFALSFSLGSIFSVSLIYFLASYVFHSLQPSIATVFLLSVLVVFIDRKTYFRQLLYQFSFSKFEIIFFYVLFIFSFYIFNKSFIYDPHGNFLIASNIYMDFGAHIPFIRSFSLGHNFPGEVPFFAGKSLIYYFLFDFYTGLIEFLGLRIDLAYNILSSLSFTLLIMTIYKLGEFIFKDKIIGFISVFLFLFSSNLSFTTFFTKNGFNFSTISSFWHNGFYLESFKTPLSSTIEISNFWNLNPYLNQRHLAFGLLFTIILVYILLSLLGKNNLNKISLSILGISLGLLPFWHSMMFVAIYILFAGFFIFYPKLRKNIFTISLIGLVFALPELLAIKLHSTNTIIFEPGFVLSNRLTLYNFLIFWVINLGFSIFTILFSLTKISKEKRKLFIIFMFLFIFPNIFHLSTRFIFDDHKFLSLWIIFMNIFSAFSLIYIFRNWFLGKIMFVLLFILLTLSGYLSFLVIKNDVYAKITDYPNNQFMVYALKSIPSDEVVLTNGEIYDPLSLIGKKIFLGRVQYVFVYGGDAKERGTEKSIVLSGGNFEKIKEILTKENIHYIVLYKDDFAKNSMKVNFPFYEKNFKVIYNDKDAEVFKI